MRKEFKSKGKYFCFCIWIDKRDLYKYAHIQGKIPKNIIRKIIKKLCKKKKKKRAAFHVYQHINKTNNIVLFKSNELRPSALSENYSHINIYVCTVCIENNPSCKTLV